MAKTLASVVVTFESKDQKEYLETVGHLRTVGEVSELPKTPNVGEALRELHSVVQGVDAKIDNLFDVIANQVHQPAAQATHHGDKDQTGRPLKDAYGNPYNGKF